MTTSDGPTGPASDDSGRLNGWKEISAFLGKGVRTAQRWEQAFGMPVHRLGQKGGEIVFAYRDELARWLRTKEADAALRDGNGSGATRPIPFAKPPASTPSSTAGLPGVDSPRGRWLDVPAWALLAAFVVPVAVVGMRSVLSPSWRAPHNAARQPSSWKITGNRLQTFDATGTQLWEHHLDVELQAPSPTSDPYRRNPIRVLLRDLDGDGNVETLLTALASTRAGRDLYCFNSDGSIRFVDRVGESATFGDTVFHPPWLGYQLFVTTQEHRAPTLWSAVIHGLWFPTRLRRLHPTGQLLSEYWSNGYIEFVNEAVWQGQRVLLVGGTNNESRGSSLAVFDVDRVTGSAPASDPKYACRTCPPGGPMVFLVFPQSCVEKASDDQGFVYEAWPEGDALLRVLVRHVFTHPTPDRALDIADVTYTFDRDYRLVDVEWAREFRDLHARLNREGLVDHPLGPDDEHALWQVTRWNGAAFETVPRAR